VSVGEITGKRHAHSYHGGTGGAEALRQLHRTLIDLRGGVWGNGHSQDTFLEIDQDQTVLSHQAAYNTFAEADWRES
jgi:hypothetical protein